MNKSIFWVLLRNGERKAIRSEGVTASESGLLLFMNEDEEIDFAIAPGEWKEVVREQPSK